MIQRNTQTQAPPYLPALVVRRVGSTSRPGGLTCASGSGITTYTTYPRFILACSDVPPGPVEPVVTLADYHGSGAKRRE